MDAVRERGEAVMFALPHPRWILLVDFVLPGLMHSKFPLWSLPLPLTEPIEMDAAYGITTLSTFDARVDMLWAVAARNYECQIVRDSRALRMEAGPPTYDVLGIERGGELAALVCSQAKGDRQWMICDLLAVDEDARRAALIAACNLAHCRSLQSGPDKPITKVAILAIPALQPALSSLGFSRDKYDFHLVVHAPDGSIAKELDPARWYVSAND